MQKRIECIIRGRVQGVLFRDSTRRRALRLGLTGFVQNRPDGTVYLVAEGEEPTLKQLLVYVAEGPMFARVREIEPVWKEYSGEFKSFTIVYSSFWDHF